MENAECADLELSLTRRDAGLYAIEMRFTQPGSEADVRLEDGGPGGPALVSLDFAALREQLLDAGAYGRVLGSALFAAPAAAAMYARADATAAELGVPLRLRLAIGPDAPELHGLRWETLRLPDDAPLVASERVQFSRYLSSADWQPVRLRPQAELRVLVAIANPAGLDAYGLAPVDVQGLWKGVQASLGALQVEALLAPGEASIARIAERLRDGHDVLYLVCHGSWQRGASWLWLEDSAGNIDRVAGETLVGRIAALGQRPRLVVLAACEGAGDGQSHGEPGEAMAALGPSLARAGVPAVLAMQGTISAATVDRLMPRFFAELRQEGQVDRALARARAGVQDRPDGWMPALFMRLRSGRIGYTPGFGGERSSFEKWPALLQSIKSGRCTPIVGPGLAEPLIGGSHELARRWAEAYRYPLTSDRDDLPQVAQYLVVQQGSDFPRDQLETALRDGLRERWPQAVPGDMSKLSLDEQLVAAAACRRTQGALDPFAVLAALPLPIYLTTAVDRLLEHSLGEAGKSPASAVCAWQGEPGADAEPGELRPDPQHPLVYHLFGRLDAREAMVLTEDDHFDFLIGVTGNRDLIPVTVRRALADTALLFLGFHMEDWNFRVLFRSIMNQQGGGRRKRYAHIAAQIDPEQGRAVDVERARRYLEEYFDEADITIYWGSAEDFLRELQGRMNGGGT
jgi:hypothetical protein